MKQQNNLFTHLLLMFLATAGIFSGCTKYENGFLSPYTQYTISEFSIVRGRVASSNSLNGDGSSVPLVVKMIHIYDSTGNIVDDIFTKKYPVGVWTGAYDPTTDTTYASIFAKRTIDSLPPITINETNGTIQANSATFFLPLGSYTMDLSVSNQVGSESLKKAMLIIITDGKQVELAPETGSFSNSLAKVGVAAPGITIFNGGNNPYDSFVVTRFADTPNVFILKVMDRNGVPFDPKTGDLNKRPNTGLNPTPAYLQNLQDYAPDTFIATDTAISIHFPLVPFPINSLGNGYNMYYNILSRAAHIDSTSSWGAGSPDVYYQGPSDPHYLGTYLDDEYNYYLRIPLRIQYPGSYQLNIWVKNLVHR
jgi:hypothetical protein